MSLNGGECTGFPYRWIDRMWGNEDIGDPKERMELRRAAVRICEACPVRVECLAYGIVRQAQDSIYGGLTLRARRNVRDIATRAGIRFSDRHPSIVTRDLARFLHDNPEIIPAAQEQENERKREWRRVEKNRRNRERNNGAPPATGPSSPRPDGTWQDELPI